MRGRRLDDLLWETVFIVVCMAGLKHRSDGRNGGVISIHPRANGRVVVYGFKEICRWREGKEQFRVEYCRRRGSVREMNEDGHEGLSLSSEIECGFRNAVEYMSYS